MIITNIGEFVYTQDVYPKSIIGLWFDFRSNMWQRTRIKIMRPDIIAYVK